mgnify:CR=1 FL=1
MVHFAEVPDFLQQCRLGLTGGLFFGVSHLKGEFQDGFAPQDRDLRQGLERLQLACRPALEELGEKNLAAPAGTAQDQAQRGRCLALAVAAIYMY